ncbi:FtsX-like permease family protein [Brevibacillus fluminis]|uniref:FtsX-like permease family protein n=1 Tax=Brevibacillus fluminis TaxID=511487 RepID=UPI003F8A3858
MNLQTAWRNLMRRKLRTLLTIISIVIGVSATFGVIASVDTAKRTFPLYLKAAFGKADYTVSGTAEYFPETVHDEIGKLQHIASVAVVKQPATLHWEQEGVASIQKRVEISGYSNLDTPVTAFQVVEGNLSSGGAIITDRTASVWKTGVGDTITFDTVNGKKQIQIAAIVKYTAELMGPSSWSMAKYHPWAVAVPLHKAQEWFDLPGKIQNVQIKTLPQADSHVLQERLNELAKRYGNIYTQPVVIQFDSTSNEMNTFFMALYIAGFLGIALSAIVIFNSLYVSIKERKNEFATLKTIGYTPAQLQGLVLSEVMLLAVIGTAVGLVFGFGLAYLLKAVVYMIFSIHDDGGMLLGKGIAISATSGILVPIIAALYPIRQAGKVSVIQALKETAAVSASQKKWQPILGALLILSAFFIKHLLLVVPLSVGIVLLYPSLFKRFVFVVRPVYTLLFGFSGTLAVSNLHRNLGRTAMTSVILCLGIAMIVLMSSLNSAFVQTYEKLIYASYGGNLDVMFHHSEKTDLEQLKQIEGVADAEMYSMHSVIWTLNGQKRNLPVFAVDAARIDRFPLFSTSGSTRSQLIGSLGNGDLILDQVAYSVWGGKIGDSITLDTLQGAKSFKVVAVVETMKNGGYGAFMTKTLFKDSFGLTYEKNALVLKKEGTDPMQLREKIFDRFGVRIMKMFGPEDQVSVVSSMLTGSFSVINFLVVLSIIISGVGITNTLLLNIMERIRELGMMRAVGVTRRQVIHMVILEGFGIGLAATVIGCAFGILLIYLTSSFFAINALTYQFGVPWSIILLIALFGLLVSLISSFTPASKAAKTHLSEALRYE